MLLAKLYIILISSKRTLNIPTPVKTQIIEINQKHIHDLPGAKNNG